MYIYKEHNDNAAYGEEKIKLFTSHKDAVLYLKNNIEHFYKMSFGEIQKEFDSEANTITEDYVSISDGNNVFFWIIEEKIPDEDVKNPVETCSMLTCSTSHISDTTADLLTAEPEQNYMMLTVYSYPFGWRVYVSPNDIYDEENTPNIPEDLRNCLNIAKQHKCIWLCLDADGSLIPELPIFDMYI